MDLRLDGAALTAWLVDTPSVSGEEGTLADAIEDALRALRNADTIRVPIQSAITAAATATIHSLAPAAAQATPASAIARKPKRTPSAARCVGAGTPRL